MEDKMLSPRIAVVWVKDTPSIAVRFDNPTLLQWYVAAIGGRVLSSYGDHVGRFIMSDARLVDLTEGA